MSLLKLFCLQRRVESMLELREHGTLDGWLHSALHPRQPRKRQDPLGGCACRLGLNGLSADVLDRSPDTVQIVKCTVSVISPLACGPLGAWTRCQKSRYNP